MKYETKRMLSRIYAIIMACLIGGGAIWSGLKAVIDGSPKQAEATYPPMLLYEGEYYVLTGMEAVTVPDDLATVYAKSVGSQDMVPSEEGTCNFGSGMMTFMMDEDKAYIEDNSGNWLICEKLEAETGEE